MSKKEYPYQNLSLGDIKGEEWEDLPGLDGYFQVSNYGRIKRQQYEMQYRNGAIYMKPEKIIKSQVRRQFNKFKRDITYFLVNRVILAGRRYNFSIPRMVYYCFVEQFDLEDHEFVIICKDTDNFNIRPSNLKRATTSQKQQRIIARKRFRSPLLDMTEQDRLNQRMGIAKKASKQVTQYNLKGRKIKTYPSAAEAQRATGVFATVIGKVASGGGISAGGFTWRWGREQRIDVKAIKLERRKLYVEKYGQKVTQYDFSGKRIAHYPCIKDAAETSGVHVDAINKVLKGEYKSAKGFFWKKGYGKENIDLSGYKWGRESMAITQSKPVKQYSLDGRYIKTFASIKLAAESVGVRRCTIVDMLKGRQHTSGGFKWKYA